ncbi:hypothetical protein BJI67_15775 (plasmid) [Acidihalobacter aeolianus]|uniref:ParB-like N-terminal domain-containing protein n=2 Tax=Acidihalobacter aeolianus TaxID=2792603 RepID=A0A1D8KCM3_9GAMM|nr:hypothetical protein BJI67_15775 [Acidihalobacter aeolianus]
MQGGEGFQLIPIDLISTDPALNPRSWFDQTSLEELAASIKEQGIIEPLIVRPALEGEGFRLVAGERRYRAAKLAELAELPCVVRHLDDAEALETATHENVHREDMSAPDEALAARKILSRCDGDHAEACRALAWPPQKLKARLLLLHAHKDVLTALTERRIKLGHAELLCTLAEDMQPGTLGSVIEQKINVSDLKAKISQFAMDLDKAIFDKTQCATCPSNSDIQCSLFEETISAGKCQNRACYQEKSEAALSEKRSEYATEYSVVFLDTEKAPEDYKQLESSVVGKSQARACRGCANFGAMLSTRPGSFGLATGEQCFDLACMNEKAEAYQRALEASGDAPQTATVNAEDATDAGAKGEASASSAKTKTAAKKPDTKAASPGVAKLPSAVLKVNYQQARDWARDTVQTDPHLQMALALDALIGHRGCKLPENASGAVAGICASTSGRLERLFAADDALLEEILRLITGEQAANNGENSNILDQKPCYTASVLKLHEVNFKGRVQLTRDYLDAHTKNGLEDVLRGAGFADWYNAEQGEGAFAKLIKGKKPEILDAVEAATKAGFSVDAQYVPSVLHKLS